MARPTKPKDVKPKALEPVHDGPGPAKDNSSGMNMLVMAVIIILCTTISSAASIYFLAPLVVKPLLAGLAQKGDSGDNQSGGDENGDGTPPMPTIGPVLDLEEFTVNLKDPGGQRYLRADLSLTLTPEDPAFESLSGEAATKWEEGFHADMAHYVPAVRDICISALTKRTAAELSTAQGKEDIKEDIKRNVDGLFQGKRKVIRVNFENFIIQ